MVEISLLSLLHLPLLLCPLYFYHVNEKLDQVCSAAASQSCITKQLKQCTPAVAWHKRFHKRLMLSCTSFKSRNKIPHFSVSYDSCPFGFLLGLSPLKLPWYGMKSLAASFLSHLHPFWWVFVSLVFFFQNLIVSSDFDLIWWWTQQISTLSLSGLDLMRSMNRLPSLPTDCLADVIQCRTCGLKVSLFCCAPKTSWKLQTSPISSSSLKRPHAYT